jgi:hypothetical protein
MLPFLKNKEASVSANAEDESERRKPDVDSFEMLDAIAEDMIEAMHSKDRGLLKSALEALVEHIKEEDVKQDESLTNEGPLS